jgi:hypothetical protein
MCARSGAKPGGDSRSRPWSRSPLGRGRLTAWCATALPAPSVACALLPDQLLVILKELLLAAAGWPSNNCVSELIGSSRSGIGDRSPMAHRTRTHAHRGMLGSQVPTSLVGKAIFLLGYFDAIRHVLSVLWTT